jgi:catechol 2,3-dioxygenase-like lactoylglutathione lyase family enzyme
MGLNADLKTIEADVAKRVVLQATRDIRRNGNQVCRLHHHAVRTDDMEATRHFYEDIIGMPMTIAMTAMLPTDDREIPFLHCFFEMGDGGFLAFFQFLPDAFGPANKLPQDGIDHHIAVSVGGFDHIKALKMKFDKLDLACCGINHGICYSLYVRDPNNMLLEFVCDPPAELEIYESAAQAAHAELARWAKGDYTPSKPGPTPDFPLPTSSMQEIVSVIHGPGHAAPMRPL